MIKANFDLWLERGDALGCFPNRIAQVRYADAWDNGMIEHVLPQLERILTRVHRLPALNWLSRPDVVSIVDELADGPSKYAEDWTEADFALVLPGGDSVSARWLLEEERCWDEMEARLLQEHLFLSAGEKVRAFRDWVAQIDEASTVYPLPLTEIVAVAVRASLLAKMLYGSESLRIILDEPNLHRLDDLGKQYRIRAAHLARAVRLVLDDPGDKPRFLTMAAVRSCDHIFQLDRLLQSAQSSATANLLTYLRCVDAPN